MMNLTIVITALLAGLCLLVGMSILIYQHYRHRRKSIDWGDIERYDTPLELIPTGSNNSSFRSYKYSQLVAKQDHHWNRQNSRKRPSVGNIDRHRESRGSRTSTKSCPADVFTYPAQVSDNFESILIMIPHKACYNVRKENAMRTKLLHGESSEKAVSPVVYVRSQTDLFSTHTFSLLYFNNLVSDSRKGVLRDSSYLNRGVESRESRVKKNAATVTSENSL